MSGIRNDNVGCENEQNGSINQKFGGFALSGNRVHFFFTFIGGCLWKEEWELLLVCVAAGELMNLGDRFVGRTLWIGHVQFDSTEE